MASDSDRQDTQPDEMGDIMADINELLRRGLIAIRAYGGRDILDSRVVLTDKGVELLNSLNAQTWN